MAGWGTDSVGKYLGGFPPNFDKIIHRREEFKNFYNNLFKKEVHLSQKVIQFLTCTILRFYDDFLDIIKQCPDDKFDIPTKHPLVEYINIALNDSCYDLDDLANWTLVLKRDLLMIT